MNEAKDEKRKRRNTAIAVVSVLLLLCVFGVSGYKIAQKFGEYRKGANSYNDLQEYVFPENDGQSGDVSGDDSEITSDETQENTIGWYDRLQAIGADFDALGEINSDVVAWLTIPSTRLSYPVTQTSDNTYYLNHLFTGEKNVCGCAFLDYRNDENFGSKNSIIYGHRMNDGSMFTCLQNYKKQSYFDAHPIGILYTPNGTYTVEFFSGYLTEAYGDPWKMSFASDDAYIEWHDSLVERSDFVSNVEFSASDNVITLSTCSRSFENARYVLHGIIRGKG